MKHAGSSAGIENKASGVAAAASEPQPLQAFLAQRGEAGCPPQRLQSRQTRVLGDLDRLFETTRIWDPLLLDMYAIPIYRMPF